MPKSLKDLNWSLLVINMATAISLGLTIALAGEFTWKGLAITVASIAAKDLLSFFTEAKKQLSE